MSSSPQIEALVASVQKETDIVKKVKLLKDGIRSYDLKIIDVAKGLGVKSSYVCHLLRLNKLPEVVIDGYYSNSLTLSHLFIISRLKDEDSMIRVYEQLLAQSLSVKGTEELVRDILYGVKSNGNYIAKEIKDGFREKVKTLQKNLNATVIQTRIKSKVILEFRGDLEFTGNQLRSLMKHLESWQ